jgi:DNA-binding IclR family transcriptional regulator
VPENELESYLEEDLAPRTENTITDVGDLRAELARVREEGYATNWEESREGINAVAVPIQKPDGTVIAAVGVLGPTYRFTREKALKAPPMMVGVAREVAKRLEPQSFDISA